METLGLQVLIETLAELDPAKPLAQHVLKAGPYILNVFLSEQRMIGAVLQRTDAETSRPSEA